MAKSVLRQIVEQRLDEPGVLGRLACHLRRDEPVEQQHHDGQKLQVYWRERAGHWRCTIFLDEKTDLCLTQFDLHDDGTVRVESWEPCSVTVDPKMDVICVVRFTR